jgi:alpha-N-acetylglucosamine transferase
MPKRVDTNRVGLNPTEDRTKIYKKCQLILLTLLLLNGMLRRVRLYKKCSIQTGDLVRKIMEVLNLHVAFELIRPENYSAL